MRLLPAPLVLATVLASASARADATCISAYEQTQTLRKDGKPVAARAQAAICARDACPTLLTKDCTRWLTELEAVAPSVVLDPRLPSGARADVRVKLDGVAVTEKIDGKPLAVEPGAHTFLFEADGAPAVEQKLVLKEGEKGRKVTVTIAPAVAVAGEARPVPLGVWIFGGVSVAALATSAIFAIDGLGKKGDLEECKPRCAPGDVDSMSASLTVADVALGAGIVAGAAALYLFLTRPPAGEAAAAQTRTRTGNHVQPVPFLLGGGSGGGLGIGARF